MQRGFSAVLLPIVALALTMIGTLIWFKALPLPNLTLPKSDKMATETSSKYIFEWKSPTNVKNLKVFTNGGLTFSDHDQKKEIYPDIKQLSMDLNSDNVSWSPDERYATLFRSPLGGIYCADVKYCDRRPYFGAKVFEEVKDIYWIDNDNAIVVYLHHPNLQISKLTFSSVSSPLGNDSGAFYPSEKPFTKTPYSYRFGVVPHPATISPDGKYIIFESGYEWASSPRVLNTITGKFATISKGEDSYIISSKPNYKWQGSILEFEGGVAVDGQVGDYMNKTKPYEVVKIDLATQGY